jgi:hypothetical protein
VGCSFQFWRNQAPRIFTVLLLNPSDTRPTAVRARSHNGECAPQVALLVERFDMRVTLGEPGARWALPLRRWGRQRYGPSRLLQDISAAVSDPRCRYPISRVGQNGDEAFLGQPEYSPERKERLERIATTPKPSRKSDKRTLRMEAHQAASGGNRPGHISVRLT